MPKAKTNLPKICSVSTSEVLHCDNIDCIYHVKHYDYLEDWLIVNPRSIDCKEIDK